MSENIVKKTAKELGLTYKQLGEMIGLSEAHIKRLSTNKEISEQVNKSIEMLLKIRELELEIKEVREFKELLKKLTK